MAPGKPGAIIYLAEKTFDKHTELILFHSKSYQPNTAYLTSKLASKRRETWTLSVKLLAHLYNYLYIPHPVATLRIAQYAQQIILQ